ncbi:retrovirus-related pol polyprotein from transposon TNT 1-94 [Tanacetum coccineum]
MWATAMKIALKGKNKMGFIDGTFVKQESNAVFSQQWIVLGWIFGSLSQQLEESYRGLHPGVSGNNKSQLLLLCYELIGYPVGFKINPNMSKQGGNNKRFNGNSEVNQSLPTTSGSLSSSFTNKQMMKLLSLINEKFSPSANIASQHMTDSTKDMFNIVDISSLMLTVGHPNGTLAKITTISSLRLTIGIVMFDVLVVLEYNVSVLSVNKMIKNSKFVVGFDEYSCYIQDLKLGKIVGTSSETAAGQRKPEGQWTANERKAANLDQRLKSLIMSVLLDDQMNSVINCLTAKSTWDDLILYHKGPSDVKESRVMGLKLCYNTFKFKEDSPGDEEDTRSSHEYLNNLEEEYQERALLAKFKRFFKKGTQRFSNAKATDQTECHKCGKKGHFVRDCWSKTSIPSYQSPFQPKLLHSFEHKPKPRHTKDFEARYNKIKAKLALLSSNALAPSSSLGKNKALMALTDEERVSVGKESANNGEWVKIYIQKVHTLLEMEDNDARKSFLDYLCIDLNYVEEQRNNLMSKHRNLVQDLNTCKEYLLVLKQAKIDLLTMQHVNPKILEKNQNLRNELKELTSITEAWLNNSNKVNQCISEQIPTQKKKILGIDQLTKDTSSSGPKDLVFVKSLADNLEVPSNESQRNTTDHSVVVSNFSATDYDSAHESSVCCTPLSPLEKLTGVEPVSRPNTIKLILNSKFIFKVETLKGITIIKPSSAPARGNKSSLVSKTNSAPTGKLKNIKIEDDPPLAIVMKELNELKLQISKNKSSYFRNKNSQQVPPNALQNKYKTQFKNCKLYGQNNNLSENCYEVLFCKKCKRTNHKTCDHANFMSFIDINQYHTGQSESSSRSRPSRPAMPFPSCIHCGYNDHQSDDCVYYPICEICGSYDHDTHGHNRIISLRRGIKPRNPQHITKNCETCGSNVHTTSDHNDIEWFRKREALQAKKVESFKASKTESSSALRSKTPTKSANKHQSTALFSTEAKDIAAAGCYAIIPWIKSQLTDYDIIYEKLPITIQLCTQKNKASPLDEPTFKRLIVELCMLNIDSKPEASVLTEEN